MRGPRLTWRRFFESHLFFVSGLIVLILLSVSLTRAQLKDRSIRQEVDALQNQVEALETERGRLTELITLFEKPEFLEKEARRILGYVKPGEEVVVIEKSGVRCQVIGDRCANEENAQKISNPKKWWVYFFGS